MNITNKIFFIILIYEFNFIYYLHSSTTNKVKPSKRQIGICKANQTYLSPVTIWEIKNETELQQYPCSDDSSRMCSKPVIVQKKVMKTVSVKEVKLVSVCCKGYRKMNNKCMPICYPECEHGKCIKPNTCKCDDGYKSLTNSRCSPDCQNCQNGYCLTPTDCKCYSLYEKSANGSCVPRCDPKCVNGDCFEPDVCTCRAGYEMDVLNNHTCNPLCQLSCGDGGRCIEPDVCECNFGYRLNATRQCEPICEHCNNGVCIKPGECACNENYKSTEKFINHKIEMICEPICQVPCKDRGRCVAPDECECGLDYRLNKSQQCEPICNSCDNGICINPGECVCNKNYENKTISVGGKIEVTCEPICELPCGDGGHCSRPNTCECSVGYRLNETEQCEPICESCNNGVCIKPDICVCYENYEHQTTIIGGKSVIRCEPICQVPCGEGGHCISPNVCECSDGFRLNSTRQCEAVCRSCDNGICIKPGVCVCNEHYESTDEIAGDETETSCKPICQVPCGVGGHCISPNVCECDIGYRLNATKQCEPVCKSCENGVCIKPDVCICNENYESRPIMVDHNIEMRCQPICTIPCVNAFCSDVNECTCKKGYERDENFKHICNELCDPPCLNGRCLGGNQCECLSGYLQHAFEDHVCVDCNFTCTESEDCSLPVGCPCPDSEELNNETKACEKAPSTTARECSGECMNSNCTYGHCICYEGYNKYHDDSNICFPLCNNRLDGCIHGICGAPDVCECIDGYKLSPYTKFECILVEYPKTTVTIPPTTTITTPTPTSPSPTSSTSSSSSSSTTEFGQRSDKILDLQLNQVPDAECPDGDCHREMDSVKENDTPLLLRAHYNYIFIVIGVAVIFVIIILTMIYRKYNRTKTFKTHEQEAFLSSPYFIGGPIKTSCDIELEEN